MAFRYCWVKSNHNDLSSLPSFDNHVYLITFGEDVNGSISKHFRHSFNDIVVQDYMRDLDLTYTSDSKAQFIAPLRKLSDISFLKRYYTINKIDGQYIGSLERDVIFTTPGWTRKKNSDIITIDNYKFSLREAAIWGKDFFNEFIKVTLPIFRNNFPGVPVDTSYLSNISLVSELEYYY
jgi:hypothetical protein